MTSSELRLYNRGMIASSLVVVLAAVTASFALSDFRIVHEAPGPPLSPVADIVDEPEESVVDAEVSVALVHMGTNSPYKGTGAVGVNVKTEADGSINDWTLSAWAEQLSPPAIETCSQAVIYFDPYNWVYQANGGQTSQGTWMSTPSTVPQRLGPAGDQCLTRVAAAGPWMVTLCIEGRGGEPKGIYEGEGGRHIDEWDRCIESRFQVSP